MSNDNGNGYELGYLFGIVAESGAAVTLMVAGICLILLALYLARQVSKKEPSNTSALLRISLLTAIVLGSLLVCAGPIVSWSESIENGIRTAKASKSFENLQTNSRATWLIRLVAYHPSTQPDLAVGSLKQIGRPNELFTFVADYAELRGQKVSDAVRMVGGTFDAGERVAAIIFPKRDFDLYPANARGLLQVVDLVEKEAGLAASQRLLKDHASEAAKALEKQDSLVYWSFASYAEFYGIYCRQAYLFVCGQYKAADLIGKIGDDWNPLGFSTTKRPIAPICSPPGPSDQSRAEQNEVCNIKDWSEATSKFAASFGARVFFVKNFKISDLYEPYLIDFAEPDVQKIPEIGIIE